MFIPLAPPSIVAPEPLPELPLLPGSDPQLLETYRWTLAHSQSLQAVVRELARAERKARYRLCVGLDASYGRLFVRPTDEEYHIDIQVPILGWARCEDALEPWIASSLYLARIVATEGALTRASEPYSLNFPKKTKSAVFAFQKIIRSELAVSDPVRLGNLPDGLELLASGFYPPTLPMRKLRPPRRPLPNSQGE